MPTPTHKLENFPTSSNALTDVLKTNLAVGRVWLFEEIPSTQTYLEGVEHLTLGDLVIAHHQTEGRGRLSRSWIDVKEGSLLLSIAVSVSQVTTLAVGIGVVRALSKVSRALSLKWPNDVVVLEPTRYRKVGGIITTRVSDSIAVAGIGINLLAPESQSLALGLADLTENSLNVTEVLKSIIDEVLEVTTQEPEDIVQEFRERTSTLNRDVRIQAVNGKSIYGTAVDVADDGALVVDTDNGHIRIFSGDVQYLRFAEG